MRSNLNRKPRVAILSGAMETSLHPIPPVADSAPEWNVFRLAEEASAFDLQVISPCEARQLPALRNFPARGQYHHVVFGDVQLWVYRKLVRHILPLRLAVRRFARVPDLMSWWYLRQARHILNELGPDVIIINARPQYIRYLRKSFPQKRLLLFMRGELGESQRFLNLLDGIIVNSQGMRDYAREFVDSKIPIWQMPNTLGNEFVAPQSTSDRFTRADKTILFTGRIIPVKGVLELLNAFWLVLEKTPEVKLILCGAGDNFKQDNELTPYERQVRQRAESLPPDSVRFEGYIPNTRLGAYYADASVAVFPSIWKESFGMVALEAMRCRTPVVASRRPGFEEQIVEGETGFLVDDPTDAPTLAEAMLRILREPELARRMGENGYRRSLGYMPEAALRRLEAIVHGTLDARLTNARTPSMGDSACAE